MVARQIFDLFSSFQESEHSRTNVSVEILREGFHPIDFVKSLILIDDDLSVDLTETSLNRPVTAAINILQASIYKSVKTGLFFISIVAPRVVKFNIQMSVFTRAVVVV